MNKTTWLTALAAIGFDENLASESLTASLEQHGFTPDDLNCESIRDVVNADSPEDACIQYAKDTAQLHALQEFLIPAVDWRNAWTQLAAEESLSIHPTSSTHHWVVTCLHG